MWWELGGFYINDVSLSGSACDGQTDERVLVLQPLRSPHRSAGQENGVSAVRHKGRQRLVRFCCPADQHRCRHWCDSTDWERDRLSGCLRLPSSGHTHTSFTRRELIQVVVGAKELWEMSVADLHMDTDAGYLNQNIWTFSRKSHIK